MLPRNATRVLLYVAVPHKHSKVRAILLSKKCRLNLRICGVVKNLHSNSDCSELQFEACHIKCLTLTQLGQKYPFCKKDRKQLPHNCLLPTSFCTLPFVGVVCNVSTVKYNSISKLKGYENCLVVNKSPPVSATTIACQLKLLAKTSFEVCRKSLTLI